MNMKTSTFLFLFSIHHAQGKLESFLVENHFIYGNPTDTAEQYLEKSFYKKAIEKLPIICVDIVVVDPTSLEYLLVLRDNEPYKGMFWVPGGRLYKGESFFQGAQRKCKEEAGIEVRPLTLLSANSLIFEKSEWGCNTHTPTIGVVVLVNEKQSVHTDLHHNSFRWDSLFNLHPDPYVDKLRREALEKLKNLN